MVQRCSDLHHKLMRTLLLLLVSVPAWATISIVSGYPVPTASSSTNCSSSTGTNAKSETITSTVAGDAIVVVLILSESAATAPTSVSEGSNGLTLQASTWLSGTNSPGLYIYSTGLTGAQGGNTQIVGVLPSGISGGCRALWVIEFSTTLTYNVLDAANATNSTCSTTCTGASLTLGSSSNNDVIIQAMASANVFSSINDSFTSSVLQTSSTTRIGAYKLNVTGSTSPATPSWSVTGSSTAVVGAIALKEISSGGPAHVRHSVISQ